MDQIQTKYQDALNYVNEKKKEIDDFVSGINSKFVNTISEFSTSVSNIFNDIGNQFNPNVHGSTAYYFNIYINKIYQESNTANGALVSFVQHIVRAGELIHLLRFGAAYENIKEAANQMNIAIKNMIGIFNDLRESITVLGNGFNNIGNTIKSNSESIQKATNIKE